MTTLPRDDLRCRIAALESQVRMLRAEAADRALDRAINAVVVQVTVFGLSLGAMVAAAVMLTR